MNSQPGEIAGGSKLEDPSEIFNSNPSIERK